MAHINSYTGEVRSEPTAIERIDEGFAIPVEEAVLDALGLQEGQDVVLKGTIGGAALTVEPAETDERAGDDG